jgi:hypothetical protein
MPLAARSPHQTVRAVPGAKQCLPAKVSARSQCANHDCGKVRGSARAKICVRVTSRTPEAVQVQDGTHRFESEEPEAPEIAPWLINERFK